MQNYRILNPNETGKGILIEYDAGYVSPTEFNNDKIIKESINTTDYSKQIDDNNDEIFEISDDDVKNSEHPYKLYYRLAKIAERKSEINIASDNYTKALFHLENDYSHLVKIKNKFEISRQELVSTIEEKLEELNQNK